MSLNVYLVDAFAVVLLIVGGLLAFGQRAPREGDAPPSYYRRMIAGVMIASFGVIIGVTTTSYALMSR